MHVLESKQLFSDGEKLFFYLFFAAQADKDDRGGDR